MTALVSPPQHAMLLAAELAGTADLQHIHRIIEVDQRLRRTDLCRSLAELTRAIPALRTSFSPDGKIEVHDLVDVAGSVEVLDVEDINPLQFEACARKLFDLTSPPLFRVHALGHRHTARTTMVLVAHHLATDGIGFGVLCSEFLRALFVPGWGGVPSEVSGLPSDGFLRRAGSWRAELMPLPSHPAGFRPKVRPTVQPSVCAVKHLQEPARLALRVLRRRQRSSDAILLAAAFAAALHKLGDLSELLIMFQADTRSRASRRRVGMLVNTLPVRSRLSLDDTWSSFLERQRDTVLRVFERRLEPLDAILRDVNPIRRSDGSSVFSDFEYSALPAWSPPADVTKTGVKLRERLVPDLGTRYGVSMNVVVDGPRVSVKWALASARFDVEDLDRLHLAVEAICAQAAADAAARPARFELVAEHEREELLRLGRGPQKVVPIESVAARFLRVARRSPATSAVRAGDAVMSYEALAQQMGDIATRLSEAGVGRSSRVAVYAPRGARHVAAMLAVNYVGGVYVPLDMANPWTRLQRMIDEVDPGALLVDAASWAGLDRPEHSCATSRAVIDLDGSPLGARRSLAPVALDAGDPAYIVFTSGSTGRPRAVEVSHGAFVNHLAMMEELLDLDAGTRVAQTAELGFDIHVWQCISPLLVGGEVQVIRSEVVRDPETLLDVILRWQTDVVELVPAYLAALVRLVSGRDDAAERSPVPTPRHLISTGEGLGAHLAAQLVELFPHTTITNAYGPAEAADDVSFAHIESAPRDGHVPIGWPARNIELLVLDRWGSLRPPGHVGELTIAGEAVAGGYVGSADTTAFSKHRYRPDVPAYATGDRCLLDPTYGFKLYGRADSQVKLAGRRLELGEIETALCTLPEVTDAQVILADRHGIKRLIAFVVTGAADDAASLKELLSQLLPAYMVPSEILVVEKMPTGSNGKVDRRQLAPSGIRSADVNDDETFRRVRRHWQAVLPGSEAGGNENFFAAGGDSILAAELTARLRSEGFVADLGAVFAHQQLGDLVEVLRSDSGTVEKRAAASLTLTPRQAEMLAQMAAGKSAPVQAAMLNPPPGARDSIVDAVRSIVADAPELRYAFRVNALGASVSEAPAAHRLEPVPIDDEAVGDDEWEVALLLAAARELDVSAGCHVAISHSRDGWMCLVISHLVCDLVSLRVFLAMLDARLRNQAAQSASVLSGTFVRWAAELSRRSRAQTETFPRYVSRVDALTAVARERAPPQTEYETAVRSRDQSGRIATSERIGWPDTLPEWLLPTVSLAAVARAMSAVMGLKHIRIDLDEDVRMCFAAEGLRGEGLGCFTALRPVAIALQASDADLLSAVELSLATTPEAPAWDLLSQSERDAIDRDLRGVPLLNVVGSAVKLTPYASLGRTRVPACVPLVNSASDPHGITIDVMFNEDRGPKSVLFRCSGDRQASGLVSRVATLLADCAPSIVSAAVHRHSFRPAPLPSGLELLDLEPEELAQVLARAAAEHW